MKLEVSGIAIQGYIIGQHGAGRPSPLQISILAKGKTMRLLLAIFLPFAAFFTIGRPIAGIVCLILQITLIGWLPAAIWAAYALSQYNTDRKIAEAMHTPGRGQP